MNCRFKKYIAIIIFFTCIQMVLAEGSTTEDSSKLIALSIQDAIQRSMEYNLDIKISDKELQKKKISKNASWYVLLPKVSLSVQYLRMNKKPELKALLPTPRQSSMSASLGIDMPFADVLVQNIVGIFVSISEYKKGKITFMQMATKISFETQKIYFNVLIAERALETFLKKMDVAKKQREEAFSAYKNGLKDEYTYLKTELFELKAQQSYNAQKQKVDTLRRSFALLLGYSLDTKFVLTDEVPHVNEQEIEQIISDIQLQENFTLQQQFQDLKTLKLKRIRSFFGLLPSAVFSYRMTSYLLVNPTACSITQLSNWSDDNGNLKVTVSVYLNRYLPWSRQIVNIRTLNAGIQTQEMRIEKTRINNQNQLHSLIDALHFGIEAFENSKAQVKTAEKAYILAQESYRNGLMEVTVFLQIEADLQDAIINRIVQEEKIIENILDISFLAGKTKVHIK